MGRELQKKKNRSSIAKVRQKAKSKKKILSNPIIAANWNQKETLAQNYRRLGLASNLNAPTGGTEKTVRILEAEAQKEAPTSDRLKVRSKLPTTFAKVETARIERHPETGAILRVLDEPKLRPNPLNDRLNEIEDDEDEGWQGFVDEHGVVDQSRLPKGGKTEVVRQLEEEAARPVIKKSRKQSEREEEWIERLVEKYGDDYGAMSMDMKLNPMQQSAGDLKRRVKKWKKAHGEE